MQKNKAFILMYHRVLTEKELADSQVNVQPSMYVTTETFEMHLKYLKDNNYKTVFLSELSELINQKKDISKHCVITFDDGWLDNYTNMFPILIRNKIKVSIFITSGFTGTSKLFWPEEVAIYIESIVNIENIKHILKNINLKIIDVEKVIIDKSSLNDAIISHLKSFSKNKRNELINMIKENAGPVLIPKQRLLMSWKEIKEMANSGLVEFGSHTVNHELLDRLDNDALSFEITESVRKITNILGKPCEILSYPNGNYNAEVLNAVADAKISAAVTTKRGYVSSNSDLLTMSRIGMHEDVSYNLQLFLWRLSIR
jgi:peptidoglycan/xylan/chitin deacetylase (PgdA/CDA1 family)